MKKERGLIWRYKYLMAWCQFPTMTPLLCEGHTVLSEVESEGDS